MRTRQRTEITTEMHELTVIRFQRNKSADYCSTCQDTTRYVSVDEAVSILSISFSEIDRLASEKKIHSLESNGQLLLCGNSLLTSTKIGTLSDKNKENKE